MNLKLCSIQNVADVNQKKQASIQSSTFHINNEEYAITYSLNLWDGLLVDGLADGTTNADSQ